MFCGCLFVCLSACDLYTAFIRFMFLICHVCMFLCMDVCVCMYVCLYVCMFADSTNRQQLERLTGDSMTYVANGILFDLLILLLILCF